MEGWLYGLFTLVGVLAGGLFTYLGMRKQLEQQSKLDSRHWKREVRGEPLLKLRAELARMATKQEALVGAAHKLHTRFGITEEQAKEQLKEAVDGFNTYLASGSFQQTLFMQDDKGLLDKVDEIISDYRGSYIDAIYYKDMKATELGEAMRVFERNKTRIMETQSMINKQLEKL